MIQTIFLHVGPPKTGSTTLQLELIERESALLEVGFLYPQTGRLRVGESLYIERSGGVNLETGPSKFHNLITWSLQNKIRTANHGYHDILDQLRRELVNSSAHTAIVSGEGLYHLDQLQLNKVKEALAGIKVKIVFYYRDPVSRAKSMYSQAVRKGKTVLNFKDYVSKRYIHNLRYHRDKIAILTSTFGGENMIVKDLARVSSTLGLVQDFFSTVGFRDVVPSVPRSAKNTSLSPAVLSNILRLNRVEKAIFGDSQLRFVKGLCARMTSGGILSRLPSGATEPALFNAGLSYLRQYVAEHGYASEFKLVSTSPTPSNVYNVQS